MVQFLKTFSSKTAKKAMALNWIFLHKDKCNLQIVIAVLYRMYADLAPLLNHPGCLKISTGRKGKNISWKTKPDSWLVHGGLKDGEFKGLNQSRTSPKFVVLFHLIAMAFNEGEKILIFSKCLKTLDLVEDLLCTTDWKKHIGSLKDFSNLKLGGLKRDKDYLRIDGSVQSGRRGLLIDKFNKETSQVKLFLISSEAGGIGINLVRRFLFQHGAPVAYSTCELISLVSVLEPLQCSASIVAILDNHFNPSVSQQCISRVHRYGQTKPVRCYRFAMENSVEAKVYARSENKAGVAKSVLDGIFHDGVFSADELKDLYENDQIVRCDHCGKNRKLLDGQSPPDDDNDWYCNLNTDQSHNKCEIPEEKSLRHFPKRTDKGGSLQNDPFLQHLLSVKNGATMKAEIVSEYLPVETSHETDICCEEAIKKFRCEIEAKPNEAKPNVDVDSKPPKLSNSTIKWNYSHQGPMPNMLVAPSRAKSTPSNHLPAKRKVDSMVELVDLTDD
jgi:hypothetical protein